MRLLHPFGSALSSVLALCLVLASTGAAAQGTPDLSSRPGVAAATAAVQNVNQAVTTATDEMRSTLNDYGIGGGQAIQNVATSVGNSQQAIADALQRYGIGGAGLLSGGLGSGAGSALDGKTLQALLDLMPTGRGAVTAMQGGNGRGWTTGMGRFSDLLTQSFSRMLSPSRGFGVFGRAAGSGAGTGSSTATGATPSVKAASGAAGTAESGRRLLQTDGASNPSTPTTPSTTSLMDLLLRTDSQGNVVASPYGRPTPYGAYPYPSASIGRNLRPYAQASQRDVNTFAQSVQQDMVGQAQAMADYWNGVANGWTQNSQEAALAAACASYGLGQAFTDFATPLQDGTPSTAALFNLYGAYYNDQYASMPQNAREYFDALCCGLLLQDKENNANKDNSANKDPATPGRGVGRRDRQPIFDGYAAGQYTYPWAQPPAADDKQKDNKPKDVKVDDNSKKDTQKKDGQDKGTKDAKAKDDNSKKDDGKAQKDAPKDDQKNVKKDDKASKPQVDAPKKQPDTKDIKKDAKDDSSKADQQQPDVLAYSSDAKPVTVDFSADTSKKDTKAAAQDTKADVSNKDKQKDVKGDKTKTDAKAKDDKGQGQCKSANAADYVRLVYGPSAFADELDNLYQAYKSYQDRAAVAMPSGIFSTLQDGSTGSTSSSGGASAGLAGRRQDRADGLSNLLTTIDRPLATGASASATPAPTTTP